MDKGKAIALVTFFVNMLIAFPFAGLLSWGIVYLFYYTIYQADLRPEWSMFACAVLIDFALLFAWGKYQYRLIVEMKSFSRKESFRNLLILAGILLAAGSLMIACLEFARKKDSDLLRIKLAVARILQPGCALEISGKKSVILTEQSLLSFREKLKTEELLDPPEMKIIAIFKSPDFGMFFLARHPQGYAVIRYGDHSAKTSVPADEIKKTLEAIITSSAHKTK